MSAWTNGKLHVVAGPRGLSVHRDDRVDLLLASEQLGGEIAPKKGKSGFVRLRPVAVGEAAKIAYTTGVSRSLVRVPIDGRGKAARYPFQISALAPAEGDRVLAAFVTGTKARAMTSIVIGTPPADPKGKWEREFEADRPSKVDWPEELLWDKAPWSRKTRWTTDPDLLHVEVNRFGYAIYDDASAVVGVLRRGADAFECVLRTPYEKGTSLAATPSEGGVFVLTCKGEGSAALAHFDPSGKLLAHRVLDGRKVGALTLAGDQLVAVLDGALALFRASDLSPLGTLALPGPLPASQTCLRLAADASSFMLALADKVLRGVVDGESWKTDEVELDEVPEPSSAHQAEIPEVEVEAVPEPEQSPGDGRPRIITQAPRLGMNPLQPNDAWSFALGAEFEIVIMAVSVGGPAERGLYVELSGDALEQGLVSASTVEIVGTRTVQADFEAQGAKKLLAKLDYLVPAGVEPQKDKKIKPKERFLDNPEDTFLTVTLRGKAAKAGNGALLFVRVGFEGEQEGSLMRGRPVTVA
ncbi:hypothetical protein G6O69_32795 [Pseudenhygromyxa sp. WMMC2535]|uniref:hypothetical protein n=1 Tax=Pseudenhygromyxa sp. WMMC2535 TaxID=2712867 RepID=UPI0015533761|nr:hypothetical protein [Pseudenhygromyxa sp. WMMC2535]NVB42647.1 hypothetical protein [Pseudenhygromyxa sp. WMMC2535]